MYVIRYKKYPATLEHLYRVHGLHLQDRRTEEHCIAARTRRAAVREFIHHFGGTWPQRKRGVDCVHVASLS